MSRCVWLAWCCLGLVGGAAAARGEDNHASDLGLRVPDGFEASLYAGDELAHNIFSMTIDAAGRVVVAGPGYVKVLEDRDRDGRAEAATLFSPTPASGAHGMYFDGNDLVCTGDDAVRRLRDADGDGRADGEGEIWARLRHPEHGANGLVRGPDGCYWLVCGNDAGLAAEHAALAGSPVKEPRSGGIVRFSPDGQQVDVFAHGFRNPYDLDFHAQGQLFTVDADGERDHCLPWYAPTRLFDVAQGMEHGWLLEGWQRSWNRPESFLDNVERLVEIGRGSPTGLVVYRHRQFPERYRGGVFTACWTLGRVYYIPLERMLASYRGQAEIFLRTTGDVGFAPVDLAVGAEGDLFVAVGGRGTRGSVFRVRYASAATLEIGHESDLDKVLLADQPLSSWSRARWVPLARKLGREPFESLVADPAANVESQCRAVEVLTELFEGVAGDVAARAIAQEKPRLAARVAWAISRRPADRQAPRLLARLTYAEDPGVLRSAWEALAALPALPPDDAEPQPNWTGALENRCRRVRAAMLTAARGVGRASFDRALGAFRGESPPRQVLGRLWVLGPKHDGDPDWTRSYTEACLRAFSRSDEPDVRLEAVRLIEIALGDLRVEPGEPEVHSGYLGNSTDEIPQPLTELVVDDLAPALPTGDAELDRELARLLAMLAAGREGLLEAVATRWTPARRGSPEDDIHYLIVASRLRGERSPEVSRRTAHALAELHSKMAAREMYPDRNWPLRVRELFEQLCRRDPALADALVNDKSFGLPEHSLFAAAMSGRQQEAAARRLLAAVNESSDLAWTAELVDVVAALPDEEVLPQLRNQWSDHGLRDAIALALARRPQAIDRARFVEALSSAQPGVVQRSAEALASLPGPGTAGEIAAALRTLREYSAAPQERDVRLALAKMLAAWSGQPIDVAEVPGGDLSDAYRPWFDWFLRTHPEAAADLAGFGGQDAAAWRERLAGVAWEQGDAERGRLVFEKRACHHCHAGGGRLGPDLKGAAARFSRDDLFAAIVEPSKDVSPLYQTTLVTTQAGRIYHGLVVYESAGGVLLDTGPGTTVRINGDELAAVRPSPQSLMPDGLLNEVADHELADLHAYLKTLAGE